VCVEARIFAGSDVKTITGEKTKNERKKSIEREKRKKKA
jgi:hypothetical protein